MGNSYVTAMYKLTVNGEVKEVTAAPDTPLLWVLRDELKMTGTKYGCGVSACGACTVHVAGIATRSCVVPISLIGDRPVLTIEGIGRDPVGRAVQDAWVSQDVVMRSATEFLGRQISFASAIAWSRESPRKWTSSKFSED